MISAYWLIVIVPVAVFAGFMLAAILASSSRGDNQKK